MKIKEILKEDTLSDLEKEKLGLQYTLRNSHQNRSFKDNRKLLKKLEAVNDQIKKLKADLNEGMEFNACTVEDNEHGGKTVSPHDMRQEKVACWVCDGVGKEKHGDKEYECGMCKGTAEIDEWVCGGPSMQVSNANGYAIQRDILGLEADHAGMVDAKDLPALRRKLIKMVNVDKERESMHSPFQDEQGPMRAHTDDQGNTKIGRGPRMMGGERTDSQVLRYAQTLLDMVDYAMKNDLVISWA